MRYLQMKPPLTLASKLVLSKLKRQNNRALAL